MLAKAYAKVIVLDAAVGKCRSRFRRTLSFGPIRRSSLCRERMPTKTCCLGPMRPAIRDRCGRGSMFSAQLRRQLSITSFKRNFYCPAIPDVPLRHCCLSRQPGMFSASRRLYFVGTGRTIRRQKNRSRARRDRRAHCEINSLVEVRRTLPANCCSSIRRLAIVCSEPTGRTCATRSSCVRRELAEAVTRFAADPARRFRRSRCQPSFLQIFAAARSLAKMSEATPKKSNNLNAQQYWGAVTTVTQVRHPGVEGYAPGAALSSHCALTLHAVKLPFFGRRKLTSAFFPVAGGTITLGARLVGLNARCCYRMTGRMFRATEPWSLGGSSRNDAFWGMRYRVALESAADIAAKPADCRCRDQAGDDEAVNQPASDAAYCWSNAL